MNGMTPRAIHARLSLAPGNSDQTSGRLVSAASVVRLTPHMRWIKASLWELLGFPPRTLGGLSTDFHMDWLRLIRGLTLYIVPGLVAVAVVVEIMGWLVGAPLFPSIRYNYVLLTVFSLLTAIMMGLCGWIVCLWDLDRLFFKLESQIDSQIGALESKSAESGHNGR